MSARGKTLLTISAICAVFWILTLFFPLEVGAAAAGTGVICFVAWLVIKVRRAFTYASHDLADFVRGKGKSKPVENPLMRDPFYASIDAQITEAKARHKPVKHLYAKREHRVNELLGKKGLA